MINRKVADDQEQDRTQDFISRTSNTPDATSTPIFRLPEDVLWSICSILAHPLEDYLHPGLISLRHISQVCARWRKLVLAASSLWGRVINICYLTQKTDDWRDEVLFRAGESLLYVQGYVKGEDIELFIRSLLISSFVRIRRCDIQFGPNLSSVMKEMLAWAFQTPAPQLEYFAISFEGKCPSRFLSRNFRLFADHAPSLRHFSAFYFRIQPRAAWFSEAIGSLHVTGTNSFTALDFLDALSRMPFLRTLEIVAGENEIDTPMIRIPLSLRQVTLPDLIDINVDAEDAARKYLTILDHVVTEPGFNFHFQTNRVHPHPSDISTGQRVLRTYFPLSLNDEALKELRLVMDNCFIFISVESYSSFLFAMEFLQDIPDPSIFLDSISSGSFDEVTSFELTFTDGEVSPACANLLPIMSALTSVEELNITRHSLQFFLSLPVTLINGSVLLPRLQSLRVDLHYLEQDLTSIVDFLSRRTGVNLPIAHLNLGSYHLKVHDHHLETLKQFNGLKVIWMEKKEGKTQVKEFICGSLPEDGCIWNQEDTPSI